MDEDGFGSEYGTSNNEDAFLLPADPLDELVGCLGERRAGCRRRRNGIKVEEWSRPREGDVISRGAVKDLRAAARPAVKSCLKVGV